MTGAEHYAESERLLTAAARAPRDVTEDGGDAEAMYAMTSILAATAQVHATLALAAGTLAATKREAAAAERAGWS